MMYETLAHHYDALVKDDEATSAWVQLIQDYVPKGHLLELACGSGEITIALAALGYELHASDLSMEMLAEAQKKTGSENIQWSCMNMCSFTNPNHYDGILCLCDSFNYILKEKDVTTLFQTVYEHLHEQGVFLMDMHSMDRLVEFEEEYNEAGVVDGHEYQWTIYSDDEHIYQAFAFYDEEGRVTLEQHTQRVYDPIWIKDQLECVGFEVQILTDFDQVGITTGEKQFYICRKVSV